MLHGLKADELFTEETEVVEGNEMGNDGYCSVDSWASFSGLDKKKI